VIYEQKRNQEKKCNMSLYKLKLSDYHAIKEAEIRLDGITVLAGPNGCGKSTLSRWFYYVVSVTNNFDSYVISEASAEIDGLINDMFRISGKNQRVGSFSVATEDSDITALNNQAKNIFNKAVDTFVDSLENDAQLKSSFESRKQFILAFFRMEGIKADDIKELQSILSERIRSKYDEIVEKAENRIKERSIADFKRFIPKLALKGDEIPKRLQFFENEQNIFQGNTFNPLLVLRTPVFYQTERDSNSFGIDSRLKSTIGKMDDDAQIIRMLISRMINGSVSLKKDDTEWFGDKELHYVRKDGLDIPLKAAASGIKSLAEMLQLLENGWLNRDTLLIIDEPEVHLHPQWIVDYARILVFLNKKLGVKILISSHNPDMVAAIQSIARREQTLSNTRFYIAIQSTSEPMKYEYKDLGDSVEEIFDSFNIALSRIEMYGTEQ